MQKHLQSYDRNQKESDLSVFKVPLDLLKYLRLKTFRKLTLFFIKFELSLRTLLEHLIFGEKSFFVGRASLSPVG